MLIFMTSYTSLTPGKSSASWGLGPISTGTAPFGAIPIGTMAGSLATRCAGVLAHDARKARAKAAWTRLQADGTGVTARLSLTARAALIAFNVTCPPTPIPPIQLVLCESGNRGSFQWL